MNAPITIANPETKLMMPNEIDHGLFIMLPKDRLPLMNSLMLPNRSIMEEPKNTNADRKTPPIRVNMPPKNDKTIAMTDLSVTIFMLFSFVNYLTSLTRFKPDYVSCSG